MKGLIFIPDISGFTNFVKSIDIHLGMSITSDLLNEIIDHNPLDMELSEIEGDAILFYRIGKPIPVQKIINSYETMFEAFDTKYRRWKLQYNLQADLSLKLIVHYGDVLVYDIRGFKKLYGEVVIESHSLLKTESTVSDYILFSEDYLEALEQNLSDALFPNGKYTSYKRQVSTSAKGIAYYFLSTIRKASCLTAAFEKTEQGMGDGLYLAVGT
jgi:hypothetical protein